MQHLLIRLCIYDCEYDSGLIPRSLQLLLDHYKVYGYHANNQAKPGHLIQALYFQLAHLIIHKHLRAKSHRLIDSADIILRQLAYSDVPELNR